MVIIITDPVSNRKWRLVPLSDGLNYQVQCTPKYTMVDGKPIGLNHKEIDPDKFIERELYASSLEHGIRLIVEEAMRSEKTEICGSDWKSIAKAVTARVKKITAEVIKDDQEL